MASFQARVPLSPYETYIPYIEAIANGGGNVLTAERVTVLEPTSGSASASKYIPFTRTLREQFQQGIAPWIFDLFFHRKKIILGKAYWSVTPVSPRHTRTAGGLPVGFEEDAQYFGALERHILQHLLVVPKEVAQISDMDAFRYVTLLFPLREKHLAFISVWNPTFLTLLLKPLTGWANLLISDIRSGTISPPGFVQPDLVSKLLKMAARDKRRANELARVWAACSAGQEPDYEKIWPRLALISCWADANAKLYVRQLKEAFPHVEIQGKGLLATEGVVSFPLTGMHGSALAVTSHFFEFMEMQEQGDLAPRRIRLAHELEKDKLYAVVLTTGGGLYRYRLQDVIRVEGFLGQCPFITFVGKEDNVSDLFGEKLSERHVEAVFRELLTKHDLQARFYMLAPEKTADGRHFYTVFIETIDRKSKLLTLIHEMEARLQENYHYQYCRRLGQLEGLQLFLIAKDGAEAYLNRCFGRGQRVGDIKPAALHKEFGWSRVFEGKFIY